MRRHAVVSASHQRAALSRRPPPRRMTAPARDPRRRAGRGVCRSSRVQREDRCVPRDTTITRPLSRQDAVGIALVEIDWSRRSLRRLTAATTRQLEQSGARKCAAAIDRTRRHTLLFALDGGNLAVTPWSPETQGGVLMVVAVRPPEARQLKGVELMAHLYRSE